MLENNLSERALVDRVADSYRGQGYDVSMNPRLEELGNFRPDAIARKNGETVIIEVKRTKSRPSKADLKALQAVIDVHPGWRMDLVWAMAEPTRPQSFPDRSELKEQLSSVQRLFESGQRGAAYLLLWSALEAALHQKLKKLGVDRRHPQNADSIVRDLISFGFVGQSDHELLSQLVRVRNTVAHGNPGAKIEKQSFQRLRKIVADLLA
jgi:uncharacterized protein YutE (UPF0331/DUF86 family)